MRSSVLLLSTLLCAACLSTTTSGTVDGAGADADAAASDATGDSGGVDSATNQDTASPDTAVSDASDATSPPDVPVVGIDVNPQDIGVDIPLTGCQPGTCDDGDPCNGVEFCSVGGVCAGGASPACDGPCERGTCTAQQGCQHMDMDGVCSKPFAWALELLRWNGRLDALRDATEWAMIEHGCAFACAQGSESDPACQVGDPIGSQTCWVPDNCGSFSSILGTVNWSEVQMSSCNEFEDVIDQSLTAADFYLKQGKSGSIGMPAAAATWRRYHYYGTPTVSWSTALDVSRDYSTGVYPSFILPNALTTIDASGGANGYASSEFFSYSGGHTTAGTATVSSYGDLHTATWDVKWESYYDAGVNALPTGCDLEPLEGTLTLEVGGTDPGASSITYVVTFDGDTSCDGCATYTTNGVDSGTVWCNQLPSLYLGPVP